MVPCLLVEAPAFSLNLLQDLRAMLSLDFMRYAFYVGTVVALASGLVGYFVVLRHQVFAVEALAHVTFSGALLAAVLGGQPAVGVLGLTVLAALAMALLNPRLSARSQDVQVGILLAWILGVGVLLLSLYTQSASGARGNLGVNVLFGSILGLQSDQVQWITGAGLVAIVGILAIARPLLFASVDPDVAEARRIPVRGLSLVFLLLVAISVAVAVPAVGSLLNSSLIVTPAAIAQRLSPRPFVALLLSALLALLFTWLGLTLGYYIPVPISFLISTLAFVNYIVVLSYWRS